MGKARMDFKAFVPQGEDRRATARYLVQTADEHGIDQRSIRSTRGGFDITDELADVLYEDEDTLQEVQDEPEKAVEDEVIETPVEDLPKSVPATQSNPQSRKGQGDSKTKTSGNRAAKDNAPKEESA